jgi:hypothetical protein
MIRIRFANQQAERRGLGYLAGRFSFKSWENGDTVVPEAALAAMAREGIPFTVHGPATYEQSVPSVRNPPATTVQ